MQKTQVDTGTQHVQNADAARQTGPKIFGYSIRYMFTVIGRGLQEAAPHLFIACVLSALVSFDPWQTVAIFLLGSILPDFIILLYKIFYKLSFRKVMRLVKLVHIATASLALLALFHGEPAIFVAGMSHILLDLAGW